MATAHLKQFLEDLELHLDDDEKSKKPIQVFIDKSLITGVQLTWVHVSKIIREQDI
jgi:hypothetical protein